MDTILMTYILTPVTVIILSQGNVNAELNCSLPLESSTQNFVQRSIEKDKHIIRVNLTITGNISTFENNNTAGLLNRHEWTFTKDDNGRSLLLLNEHFELMSLFTLSASVSKTNAYVRQDPENCLYNLTENEIETIIRLYFFNLIDYTKDSTEHVQICNKHIFKEESNKGEILYECCSKLSDEQLNCVKVQPGKWFKTFTVCQYILMIVVWGFFADLIPKSFLVRRKRVVLVHSLLGHECLNINIHKLSTPDLQQAGFFKWIWNTCVLLDFKDTNADTKSCCSQEIFYMKCSKCKWYKCLRKFAYLLIFIIMSSPLGFRFFIFFELDLRSQSYRYDQFNQRNLTENYRWYNIMQNDLFLMIFISCQLVMYIFLPFLLICSTRIKSLRHFGILENDNKKKLSDILSTSFNITFMRCKRLGNSFGIVHLLFLPITSFIALIYFCITVLPVCQLICKVFRRICSKEKIIKHTVLNHLVFIGLVFSLETVIISVFSFGESIAFFVQCAVYIMAGVILNYDTNLKYIGVVIFICLYGHEVIQNANCKFERFRKLIMNCLQSCLKNNLKNVKRRNGCDFYFSALKSPYSTEIYERNKKIIRHGGLVFYTKYHGKWNVLVSNNLLNHLASLGAHPSCPGSLSMIYLRAFGVIMSRTLLLVFVLFTILALSYDFSASMKTIFALLSGFIVTNIRKLLPSSTESWDDGSKYWKKEFRKDDSNILNSYVENWTIEQSDFEMV